MCRFPDCHTAKLQRWGLCNKHRKWIEKGCYTYDLVLLKEPVVRIPNRGCKVKECLSKHRRNGFCDKHDNSYKRGVLSKEGARIKPTIRYNRDFQCIKCGTGGKITKGFCKKHYNQLRIGLIDYDGVALRDPHRVSSYTGCTCKLCKRKPRIRGYCVSCWGKIERGSLGPGGKKLTPALVKNKGLTCARPDCTTAAHCKGLCQHHYNEGRYDRRPKINKGRACKALCCKGQAHCRGYCVKHYGRWKRRNLWLAATAP